MIDFLSLRNQLCFAVYETSSEFTKLYTSVLQPFGLTYPQYLVLLALWEKDGITMKSLGQMLNLGTGTLTPMISRMEAHGWLRKLRNKDDERRVYIFLEQKGIEKKTEITAKIAKEILSCRIDIDEYNQLLDQLQKLQFKLRNRVVDK